MQFSFKYSTQFQPKLTVWIRLEIEYKKEQHQEHRDGKPKKGLS